MRSHAERGNQSASHVRYDPHDRPFAPSSRGLIYPASPRRTPRNLSFLASIFAHRRQDSRRLRLAIAHYGNHAMTKLANAPAALSQKDKEARIRKHQAADSHQARRQARPVARRRAGRRRASPRDPPRRRAPVRHRGHVPQSQRARSPDRGSARRNVRPRPARNAAQGADDQRNHDQRPEERVRRTQRLPGKDHRRSSATTST